jgi:hypothetical protein
VNWKLIFQLSLFGLAMALATVYVVPSNLEPVLWLPIFVVSAILIARQAPGRYFLHGLALGVANSLWITAAHVLLFDTYVAHHVREAAMMKDLPGGISPRLMMACIGPIIGVASGAVIGLFAWIAARIVRRAPAPGS